MISYVDKIVEMRRHLVLVKGEFPAQLNGPFQALAETLRTRMEGVIVPSAALPGTRNVVLFGPRVAAPYLTQPVSTLDVPASITADGARPPTSLVSVVRYSGDTHAALSAWRNGIDFRFAEPNWVM